MTGDLRDLMQELGQRKAETVYLLVKFKGDEDFVSASMAKDPDDLAFQLGTECLRMRGA